MASTLLGAGLNALHVTGAAGVPFVGGAALTLEKIVKTCEKMSLFKVRLSRMQRGLFAYCNVQKGFARLGSDCRNLAVRLRETQPDLDAPVDELNMCAALHAIAAVY